MDNSTLGISNKHDPFFFHSNSNHSRTGSESTLDAPISMPELNRDQQKLYKPYPLRNPEKPSVGDKIKGLWYSLFRLSNKRYHTIPVDQSDLNLPLLNQ